MLFSWAARPAADRAAARALVPRNSRLVAMPQSLPSQTQGHLNRSRQVRLRGDLAECRIGRVVNGGLRSVELGTVQRVEGLEAELELHAFRDGRVLDQREIDVGGAILAKVAIAGSEGVDVACELLSAV